MSGEVIEFPDLEERHDLYVALCREFVADPSHALMDAICEAYARLWRARNATSAGLDKELGEMRGRMRATIAGGAKVRVG